ncbi:HPP family protein [Lactiplantibacillus plajomi]
MITIKKRYLRYLCGLGFILAMVGVATLFQDTELILPEIGALTAGTWLYRKPTWIQQPFKLFLVPSGTAVIGFFINKMAWSYPLKVAVGVALMLGLMKVLRSNLAPAFATGLLPIIINATHWSFIVAIFFWTLSLMTGVFLINHRNGKPVMNKQTIKPLQMLGFGALVATWVVMVWLLGQPQMAAIPPVIVVLFEAIQSPTYSTKLAGKQWVALVGAASLGVGIHWLTASWLLTTVIALPLVCVLLAVLKLRLPAAYAFPLLALVLPTNMETTLPIAAAGSATLFLGGLLLYRTLVDWLIPAMIHE